MPILNSEYGEGFTSLERAWHLRWETQELRRHDRYAGYVYTEFSDVEHECAGLLTEDRRAKDWGGLVPADVNAETVIILDLVPERAGADIALPVAAFEVGLHVSHHGPAPVTVGIHSAWLPGGAPLPASPPSAGRVATVAAQPFVLTKAVPLPIDARERASRLVVWAVDDDDRVIARTFLDAATVEEPNRRGANRD